MVRSNIIILLIFVTIFTWGISAAGVHAHSTDETYIWLNPQADHYDGEVQIRLEDLRNYLNLEIPKEYEAAKAAVIANSEIIRKYVSQHYSIKQLDGAEIPIEFLPLDLLLSEGFGHFAIIPYRTPVLAPVPPKLIVRSTLFYEYDKYSRSLLCMSYNDFKKEEYPEQFHHAVFSPWNSEQEIDLENAEMLKAGKRYYLWEGVRHIWIGTDHILFLITLLLPSVLLLKTKEGDETKADKDASNKLLPSPAETLAETADEQLGDGATGFFSRWIPVEGFPAAFWNIFKIVTVFTIAHSITLSLASLDFITLPSQLVESIIALSIILIAINNIFPTFHDKSWIVLFVFGLFHGLGFASVMQDLPFRMANLTPLLVCFNVGVEIGQIVIVLAVFPIIYWLRKSKFYQPVFLIAGSALMCVIAGKWFIERSLGS